MTGNSEWLSTADAAEALGLIPRTVYRLINTGELAGYKFGRVIRIKRVDIDDYIERHRIEPGELGHLADPGSDGKDESG